MRNWVSSTEKNHHSVVPKTIANAYNFTMFPIRNSYFTRQPFTKRQHCILSRVYPDWTTISCSSVTLKTGICDILYPLVWQILNLPNHQNEHDALLSPELKKKIRQNYRRTAPHLYHFKFCLIISPHLQFWLKFRTKTIIEVMFLFFVFFNDTIHICRFKAEQNNRESS